MSDAPSTLAIEPLQRPLCGRLCVPGSKSLTNRALLLAALAEPGANGPATTLTHALAAEDTEIMVAALRQLQIPIHWDHAQATIHITSTPRSAWPRQAKLFCGNSGTTLRFLAAALALGEGVFELDGIPRMRQRPIQPLLDVLQQLGVRAMSLHGNGCPPIRIESQGLSGGSVQLAGNQSSQFLSALLMAGPLAKGPITIHLAGPLVSQPYITMTQRMVRYFSQNLPWGENHPLAQVHVDSRVMDTLSIQPGRYFTQRLAIEPDASSASYFLAASAITGGSVTIEGLNRSSWQGDIAFADLLVQMGCRLEETQNPPALTLHGGPLHGIDVDMNAVSDTVMTLAVAALFAQGPTTIRGVAHIRQKESDRVAALAVELRRVGAQVAETDDGLVIEPRPLQSATLQTYNDHRLAMAFALIGLKVPGIRIQNPGCAAKTYPTFFQDLDKLRQSCESR